MIRADRLLAVVLLAAGLSMTGGLIGVVMPVRWMSATHEWLGLGPFPHQPIAEYLARGLSLMYVLLGALCFLLATDVRRYAPVITLVAVALPPVELGAAAIMLLRDRTLGLELLALAAGSTLMCVILLILQARVRRGILSEKPGAQGANP